MQNTSRISTRIDEQLRSGLASTLIFILLILCASVPAFAQGAAQAEEGSHGAATLVVPQQVRYAGKLANRPGDTVEAVFRIYAAAEGGDPLWTESQQITAAEDGSYSALLGAASPNGLPQAVFAGGAARWVGVSVDRYPEQERVPLSSVPYAMKSADAESLAGHAASDFVTQSQLAQLTQVAAQTSSQLSQTSSPTPVTTEANPGTVTGSGTAGTVPLWTGALTQGNSEIYQVGSDIGINETAPTATLDVNGTENVRGALSLPPLATATGSTGERSQLLELSASAWSSTSHAALTPTFKLLTNYVNNDTASAGGQLEFHYQNGTASANVLTIAGNGVITFAPTQTFPGALSSVTATSPLTAATTSGAVSLGLNTPALITAITPALNNQYAQLTTNNTFTGSFQQFQGSVDIVGQASGGGGLLIVTNEGAAVDSSAIYANSYGAYPAIYADGAPAGVAIAGYGDGGGGAIGVLGGVYDVHSATFKRDNGTLAYSAGVWADDPAEFATAGLFATADGSNAAVFENNSASAPTIYVANLAASGPTGNAVLLRAEGADGVCSINQGGSMACTGQLKNLVTTHDARQVETYSVQSSENWLEDYGGGQLHNGSATVTLDPAFANTANTGVEFHVFLTPKGDCEGLYVANQTATSFEVHELRKGQSNVAFDYKIVAKRSGHESERLVDVTDRMKLEAEFSHFKPLADGPPANPHQPGISRAARKLPLRTTNP